MMIKRNWENSLLCCFPKIFIEEEELMRFAAKVLILMVLCVCLGGCETFKGAAQGFQKDMTDKNGWVQRTDAWIKEHLW